MFYTLYHLASVYSILYDLYCGLVDLSADKERVIAAQLRPIGFRNIAQLLIVTIPWVAFKITVAEPSIAKILVIRIVLLLLHIINGLICWIIALCLTWFLTPDKSYQKKHRSGQDCQKSRFHFIYIWKLAFIIRD